MPLLKQLSRTRERKTERREAERGWGEEKKGQPGLDWFHCLRKRIAAIVKKKFKKMLNEKRAWYHVIYVNVSCIYVIISILLHETIASFCDNERLSITVT